MEWYVYIFRCKDKSFYIGITNNLLRRIRLHNLGKGSKYLLGKRPLKLVYKERYPDKSSARRREIQLKNWSKTKKEKLVKGILF